MKIDLLPESQASKKIKKQKIIGKVLCGFFCLLLIAGAAVIYLTANMNQKEDRFSSLKSRYRNYENLQKNVKTLKNDIDRLNKKFTLVGSLFKEFYWSEKLLLLSQLMPEEIWLKKLDIGKKGEIKMRGFLLPPQFETRPITVLSNFIKTLQKNDDFFRDFSEITLIDVKSVIVDDKNIFEFNLNLKSKAQ